MFHELTVEIRAYPKYFEYFEPNHREGKGMTKGQSTNSITRRFAAVAILASTFATTALPVSAEKIKGETTLKDSQTYGSPDKDHKHQGYDLIFNARDKGYTCRTNPKKSMDATDFVVGSQIRYEIDKDKAKIKTSANKEVQCKIVRVEHITPAQ